MPDIPISSRQIKPYKKDKHDINVIINEFLMLWGAQELIGFLGDIYAFFELYDVDEHDDWVEKRVGKEDTQNVRLVRTVYLLSKFCSHHSGRIATTNVRFKDLWKKLEKITDELKQQGEKHA
jgi:hypothetical protein